MFTRPFSICLAVLLLAPPFALPAVGAPPTKPNIVFILAATLQAAESHPDQSAAMRRYLPGATVRLATAMVTRAIAPL